MTNNKKEQKGTYISNSYAAPIVNGRIRANKVEQVDEKTKELAKLLQ